MFRRDFDDKTEDSDTKSTQSGDQNEKDEKDEKDDNKENNENNEKKPELEKDSTDDDDPTPTDNSNEQDSSGNSDISTSHTFSTPKNVIDSSFSDNNDGLDSTSELESDEPRSSSEATLSTSDKVDGLSNDSDNDSIPDEKVYAEGPSGSNSPENSSSTISNDTSAVGEAASGSSTKSDTDKGSDVASSVKDNDSSDDNETTLPSSTTTISPSFPSSSDFNDAKTTLSDDSNGSSHDQLNKEGPLPLDQSSHQEDDLSSEINTLVQQTSISSDTQPFIGEKEATSYQKHLQDRKDDNVYIFDFSSFSDSRDSRETRETNKINETNETRDSLHPDEIKDSNLLSNNQDKINDSNIIAEKTVYNSDNADHVHSSNKNQNDIINKTDIVPEKETDDFLDKVTEPIAIDFSEYYQYSDHSDYFSRYASSDGTSTQDAVLEQPKTEEVETVILEDVVIPSSFFDTDYEDKVLARFKGSFEDDIDDSILDPLETKDGVFSQPQSDSQQLESGSEEVESKIVQDSQSLETGSNEQNSLTNQNNQKSQKSQKSQEIQYDQSNNSLNETQTNDKTVTTDKSDQKTETVLEAQANEIKSKEIEENDNDRHIASEASVDQSLVPSTQGLSQDKQESLIKTEFQSGSSLYPSELDSSSGLRDVSSLEQPTLSFQSLSEVESKGIEDYGLTSLSDSLNSSFFSSQQVSQIELASEVFALDPSLDSAHSPSLQASKEEFVPEVATSLSVSSLNSLDSPESFESIDSLKSINFSEDVLASIDSPRLFTQDFEHKFQDIEQLHFIESHLDTNFPINLSVSYKLIDLTKSVELISEERSIFEPPPYDFRKDLEQQEEWEEQTSIKDKLLRALNQAKQNPTIASYLFALDRLPVVTAKGDQDQDETKQISQVDTTRSSGVLTPSNETSTTLENEKIEGNSLDNLDSQNQMEKDLDSPQVSTPIQKQKTDLIPNKYGIWTNLVQLLPELNRAGTGQFFDWLIRSKEDQLNFILAVIEKTWRDASDIMNKATKANQTFVDPAIFLRSIGSIREHLLIELIHDPEDPRAIIRNRTSNKRIEILFFYKYRNTEHLRYISTNFALEVKKDWRQHRALFGSAEHWRQEIHKLAPPPRIITLLPLVTEYDYPHLIKPLPARPSNKIETLIRIQQEVLKNGGIIMDLQYHKNNYSRNGFSEQQFNDFCAKNYEPAKFLFNIYSHMELTTKTGIQKTHVHRSFYEEMRNNPYEMTIENLLTRSRTIEALLSMTANYNQSDILLTRIHPKATLIKEIPIDETLDPKIYGKRDNAQRREPDAVAIIWKEENGKLKLEIVIIDFKRSEEDYSLSFHSDGRGMGQPIRDLPWFVHYVKNICRMYQIDISDEDIEVSCFVLTSYIDKYKNEDVFVVKGEELVRKVPWTYVKPYAGKIQNKESQLFRSLSEIRKKLDSTKLGEISGLDQNHH